LIFNKKAGVNVFDVSKTAKGAVENLLKTDTRLQ